MVMPLHRSAARKPIGTLTLPCAPEEEKGVGKRWRRGRVRENSGEEKSGEWKDMEERQ